MATASSAKKATSVAASSAKKAASVAASGSVKKRRKATAKSKGAEEREMDKVLQDDPPVPGVRASEKTKEVKKCAFLCGHQSADKDDVDTRRACVRWCRDAEFPAEPLGRGDNCWLCERLWYREKLQHKMERVEFQGTLGSNAEKLHGWRQRRAARAKEEKEKLEKRGEKKTLSDGIKAVGLNEKKSDALSLVRPEDAFYPLQRYINLYGHPDLSRNRKLGHKVCVIEGISGVVVPGDDGKMPFKLERRQSTSMELTREHDVGSDGGDESEAEGKFLELRSQASEAYDAVAVGGYGRHTRELCAEGRRGPHAEERE